MRSQRIPSLVTAVALLALIGGCEQVFTYNVFQALSRDPANLSPAQQQAYAEAALESGDTEAMAEAYAALRDEALESDDPELTSLTADLALGASGVNDVVPELAEQFLSGDSESGDSFEGALNEALGGISDTQALADAAALIEKTRDNGGTVTEEQYVLGTAALVAKTAKEAEEEGRSLEDLTATDFQDAQDFASAAESDLTERGETSDTLALLQDYVNT
jgi:hypothetical protein